MLEKKGRWVEKGGGIQFLLFFQFVFTQFIHFFHLLFFLFFVWLASMRLRHVVQESFEVRDIIKDSGKC